MSVTEYGGCDFSIIIQQSRIILFSNTVLQWQKTSALKINKRSQFELSGCLLYKCGSINSTLERKDNPVVLSQQIRFPMHTDSGLVL